MDEPNEFGFTPAQERAVDDAFHLQLGNTIVAWAAIEHQMYNWFWRLSSISQGDAARLIFYSARSFQGRFDMLAATLSDLIPRNPQPRSEVAFVRAALKIIRQYSAFRNVIAHGFTVQTRNNNTIHLVSDGDIHAGGSEFFGAWTPRQPEPDIPKAITIEHLKAAQQNWYTLKHALWGVFRPEQAKFPATPQEGLERLTLMPKWAHSEKRVKKKSHAQPSRAKLPRQSKRQRRDARRGAAMKKRGAP